MDPFAQHRQPTIAEREDEYRARRRQMVISPPRNDPFADGRCSGLRHSYLLCLVAFSVVIFIVRKIEFGTLLDLISFLKESQITTGSIFLKSGNFFTILFTNATSNPTGS